MVTDSWTKSPDWNTPAGRALKKLAASLPTGRRLVITVFGSAPLQMLLEPSLLSADVDVYCEEEDLEPFVVQAGLDKARSDFYIQVTTALSFRTSPVWGRRAQSFEIGHCTFLFPHPIDILIGKLNRLEEKDIEAFRVVQRKTRHPTEAELIGELQIAVDLFRPPFAEERSVDFLGNVQRLWPILYGREIDPRTEIIQPALAKRREDYGHHARDYKRDLQS